MTGSLGPNFRWTREQRREMERDNRKWPRVLQEVPREQWPEGVSLWPASKQPLTVFRSREFLLQVYEAPKPALVRLSVNRTIATAERWQAGISWDELQRLKGECGYAFYDAVEVYPATEDVVNDANMRHLWVMDEKLTFAWRNG